MRNLHAKTLTAIAVFIALTFLAIGLPVAATDDQTGQSGTTLTATKTATGHKQRTFSWTINKSVTPANWNLFEGDSGTSQYTIAVTKDAGVDTVYVEGQICITNGGAVATENLTLLDDILYKNGPGPFGVLLTSPVSTAAKPVLNPGESYCYPYSITFAPVAGATYKNSIRITITNHSGHLGEPFGPSPDADFSIPLNPDILINDTINVDDNNYGMRWLFHASGSTSYDVTFTCGAHNGTHLNTATIRETGQSSSASVTVNCYTLSVDKSANTAFTRTYTWSIEKTGAPNPLNLFTGDSGSVNYGVTVNATYADSNFVVSGRIRVWNNTPLTATLNGVADVVAPGNAASVVCEGGNTFPYTLAAGATLMCDYSAGPSTPNPFGNLNTATATLQNYSYAANGAATPTGTTGFSGSAAVDFSTATITEVDETISVNDSFEGALGTVTYGTDMVPKTFTYSRTFTCDADGGSHNNIASFTSNDSGATGSAAKTIEVICHALTVQKTANTALTRTYRWTIDKTGDQTALTLSTGQFFPVNYSVKVNATSSDSNWGVSGKITVYNPAPMPAILNAVSDIVSGAGAATVICPTVVSFPHSLAAGDTLTCTYSSNLGDAGSRTNTATATLQNTPGGSTDFSGSAAVNFANATVTTVDKCINVRDDKGDPMNPVLLGTACADQTLPKTFTYSLNVGGYTVCGPKEFTNRAYFVGENTGSSGSDTWTINVNVPCGGGCTLTLGYWKTHSVYGPAAHPDDTWYLLAATGPDTPFYLSGKTWYQAFWTAPQGNAYYNLAHQYMAAKLNVLNGASTTAAVSSAMSWAESFFSTYTPSSTLSKSVRQQVLAAASTLDQYNNGVIGPGHCSE